ncbi:ZnF protein [Anopheles darlingi virus]|uniref:ZnF protein n=1 Tax=Anopheles darlingi virus TaxID=2546224 RepID=A0AAE5YGE0_9MONO|nr:ZnF protein [Anopheles darlingi virus]QBK47209.1 ZnF protein [Anopheles darlingi virus]
MEGTTTLILRCPRCLVRLILILGSEGKEGMHCANCMMPIAISSIMISE